MKRTEFIFFLLIIKMYQNIIEAKDTTLVVLYILQQKSIINDIKLIYGF